MPVLKRFCFYAAVAMPIFLCVQLDAASGQSGPHLVDRVDPVEFSPPARLVVAGPAAASELPIVNRKASATRDTIRVGDDIVDGSFIKPYEITWKRTPITPEGKTLKSNLIEEKLEIVELEGHSFLKFTQAYNDTTGKNLFTTVRVADHKTFEYKAFHTGASPGGLAHLDFKGKRVTGVYAESPEKEMLLVGVALKEPVFASLAGLLIAGLPLKEGYAATFPGMGWGGTTDPKLNWEDIEVLGKEKIDVPGTGKVSTWVVRTSRSSGLRYWVCKEAPYFVKADYAPPNGNRRIYEIVEWRPIE